MSGLQYIRCWVSGWAAVLFIPAAASVASAAGLNFDLQFPGFGTWQKGQARAAAEAVEGFRGHALGLDLAACGTAGHPPAEAGVWIALPDPDWSRAGRLRFLVRGDVEGVEIGLKDAHWFEQFLPLSRFLQPGSGPWREVSVTLDDFARIHNWYNLESLLFRLRSDAGERRAVLAVDEIRVTTNHPPRPPPQRRRAPHPPPASLDEQAFLDLVEKYACLYFWNEADGTTGLVKDRCLAFYEDGFPVASIAAVGFGLPCLCVAEARGWLSRAEVYQRILRTLRFFRDRVETVHGFYYHFLERETGRRAGNSEISSIDTALLIAGALFAGEYFAGTEVEKLADELYRRVEWSWMLDGGVHPRMAWKPETGFSAARWSGFNEGLLLLILAVGSPSWPIDARAWWEINRTPRTYGPYEFVGPGVLFVHQYPHIFVDFRFLEDGLLDYYANSLSATLAARRWAIDHAGAGYGPDCWGLTACDGPDGYRAYGAPFGPEDGTVAPTAAGGSFPFTPAESLAALRHFYALQHGALWGKWGFVDAFNRRRKWISRVHIGIDQGPIALMIENYRSGLIWTYFMRNEYVRRGLQRCGFRPRTVTLDELDLSGEWEIRRGDLQPGADADVEWYRISLPGAWEEVGPPSFRGYDGYAVCRRCFYLDGTRRTLWSTNEVVLELGAVDDVDEAFLNGVRVGGSGHFPPEFATAWSRPRQYRVPPGLLLFGATNNIVLRIYDAVGQGGVWKGPVRLRAVSRYPVRWLEEEIQK